MALFQLITSFKFLFTEPHFLRKERSFSDDSNVNSLINDSILQMTFGEQNTEKEAHEILSYAFDQGINIIDTAEAVSSSTLT